MMGLREVTKAGSFYLLDKKKNIFVKNWKDKEVRVYGNKSGKKHQDLFIQSLGQLGFLCMW